MNKRAMLITVAFLLAMLVPVTIATASTSGAENMPDAVLNVIETSRWGDWEITGWVHPHGATGKNCAFAAVKDGRNNVLIAFSLVDGQWQYAWYNASALPQTEAPMILSDLSGVNGQGPTFKSFYVYQDEIQEMGCIWQRQANGKWLLQRLRHFGYYGDTGLMMFDTSRDNVLALSNDGWVDGDVVHTRVYGYYQRDLRYFDLDEFPMTVAEARDQLTNPPAIPGGTLSAKKIKFSSGQKYEVYQGPGAEYGRAANGKASVSTNDWIQVFGEENGYIMIQYDISQEQYRIGWIDAKALPSNAHVEELVYQPVQGYLAQSTSLTDDPLNSRKTVTTLAQGTTVQWLATMGDWAYIETTSGTFIRGFVPQQALTVRTTSIDMLSDVMSSISGYWAGVSGGELFHDSLMLYADGTYVGWMGYLAMEDTYHLTKGDWYITNDDPTLESYWDNPPYVITFVEENGNERTFGLTFYGDRLSITFNEGGESYERRELPADDPDVEPDEFQHG